MTLNLARLVRPWQLFASPSFFSTFRRRCSYRVGVDISPFIPGLLALLTSCSWSISEGNTPELSEPPKAPCQVDVVAFDVSAHLRSIDPNLAGIDADAADRDTAWGLIRMALQQYPASACACVGPIRLVLASRLTDHGEPEEAISYPDKKLLVISVEGSISLLRRYHHEFFHLLKRSHGEASALDSSWRAVNLPGFVYLSERASPTDVSEIPRDHPGFLTPYSMYSLNEDQAELFSHLMYQPGVVHGTIAPADRVIGAKLALLKNYVTEVCPPLSFIGEP